MAERRALKMHPRLLWDVISRQAGSLSKAVLEGAMNSIDAGATRCDILLGLGDIKIVDDGKGFTDEGEIERFFETFGYPHKEGDSRYGRFRMGRGQLFSFGVNQWSTRSFRMNVDLKPQMAESGEDYALGYEFEKVEEDLPGCTIAIDLYHRLTPMQREDLIREMKTYMAWADIPVTINGEKINRLPSEGKWTHETDDAYFKLSEGSTLDVYNLGVLVARMPARNFGSGGIVVSKRALKVSFSRTDIAADCTEWTRIKRFISKNVAVKVAKAPMLDDNARERLAAQVIAGEISPDELATKRILTDVTGTRRPLSDLRSASMWSYQISVAPLGDRIAERAHTRRMAFILSQQSLEAFGVETVQELLTRLQEQAAANPQPDNYGHRWNRWSELQHWKVVDYNDFRSVISDTHEPIDPKDLKPGEKVILSALSAATWPIMKALQEAGEPRANRIIMAGASDSADGWTDGSTRIFINRPSLKLVSQGLPGINRLVGLMLHEFIHGEPDTESHVHSSGFYELFHNLTLDTDVIGEASTAVMKAFASEMKRKGQSASAAMTRASLQDLAVRDIFGTASEAETCSGAQTEEAEPEAFAMVP